MLVSTVASGDTRPYVGASDIAMMYSVVDIAGINRVSACILSNAAAAITGMATAYARPEELAGDKRLIGATMFGVTTARERLEELGYGCWCSTPRVLAGSQWKRWRMVTS